MKTPLSILLSLLVTASLSAEHDHSSHAEHDHSSHAEHDHSAHEKHDHDLHKGHDHESKKNNSHERHNHSAHAKEDDHSGHKHHAVNISTQALLNMGVKVKKTQLSDYTVYSRIPAVVSARPQNHQGLFAPWSGRIKSIHVELGQKAVKKKTLVTLLRDPLPRVEVKMIEHVLKLASEDYHNALAKLSKAQALLSIIETENTRLYQIDKNSDLAIVPRKELLTLKYEMIKAKQEIKIQEQKLKLHGFSKKEIAKLKEGATIQISQRFWINSLKANGLWNKRSADLFKSLPLQVQNRAWTVPSIAELASQDFLTKQVLKEIKTNKILGNNFLEVAGLLQKAYSVEQILDLAKRGVFNKVITLKSDADFDVSKIKVRRGQKVENGQELLLLRNPSRMYFEVQAQGSEKAEIKKALQKQWLVQAEALTDESIETYTNLKVSHFIENNKTSTLRALVPVNNRVISEVTRDQVQFRSWELQEGLRFYIKTPKEKFSKVISVPTDSILDSGPDKIILVKEGDEYAERKVHVMWSDDKHSVLSLKSDLKAGDQVIVKAAFALQMALQQGNQSNVIDPHAGHNH